MENLVNDKKTQELDIPQINLLNLYKLERAKTYDRKHKPVKSREKKHV